MIRKRRARCLGRRGGCSVVCALFEDGDDVIQTCQIAILVVTIPGILIPRDAMVEAQQLPWLAVVPYGARLSRVRQVDEADEHLVALRVVNKEQ